MKLVAISDLHLDWRTHGRPRFAEVKSHLEAAALHAIREKVDLFVFAGDAFNPDSGMVCYSAGAELVRAALMLDDAGIESVWVPGNHDIGEDGSGLTSLSCLRALTQIPRAMPRVHLAERPWHFTGPRGTAIICLPFTATSHPYDPELFLRECAARHHPQVPVVIVSHLTAIEGIQPGEEVKELARGREVRLPVHVLAELFPRALVLQGHYHRRQDFQPAVPGCPVIHVIGSAARLTHGEASHTPGFLVAEI